MHDAAPQDRLDDLISAAHDAIKAIDLVLPDVTTVSSVALMRTTSTSLRRALERLTSDTQPIGIE